MIKPYMSLSECNITAAIYLGHYFFYFYFSKITLK